GKMRRTTCLRETAGQFCVSQPRERSKHRRHHVAAPGGIANHPGNFADQCVNPGAKNITNTKRHKRPKPQRTLQFSRWLSQCRIDSGFRTVCHKSAFLPMKLRSMRMAKISK